MKYSNFIYSKKFIPIIYLLLFVIFGGYSIYNIYSAPNNFNSLIKTQHLTDVQHGETVFFGIQKCPIEIKFQGIKDSIYKVYGTYCSGFLIIPDSLDISHMEKIKEEPAKESPIASP